MVPLQCPYCDYANPDGARFCNACGSRLHLKLCNHCEAINDQAVTNCYQCGTEFQVLSTTAEAAARAACERLQQLLRSDPPVSPAQYSTATSVTGSDVDFEPAPAPTPESVVESHDENRRRPGNKAARAAAILSTVLLSAIAVSAYYLYLDPVQLKEGLSAAQRNSSAPADLKPGGTPIRAIPEENVVATSVPPTTLDAAAGVKALGLPSQVGSSTGAATSPVTQGSTRATRSDGVEDGAPMPSQSRAAAISRPRVPTSDQATSAPPFATRAKGAEKAPHPATALAAKPRPDTTGTANNQVAPSDSAASRSTTAGSAPVQSRLSRSRGNVPFTSPRPSVCTEAIAAAGLCNLSSTEGSK